MMTYNEAYNKIIDAYFKDEIKPLDSNFCFCGTLCSNTSDWFDNPYCSHYDSRGYKGHEFVEMEKALFVGIKDADNICVSDAMALKDYEDRLFAGMSAALDVLKEIHRSRGENVDELPTLTKRQLTKTV